MQQELGDPTLTASGFFQTDRPSHSTGTIAAVVKVDADTGAVIIERILVVEDCGAMVNPMVVEGQIRGGVAQDVGLALLDRVVHEHHVTPSEHAPLGMKGMAEGPTIATPAAIACAVLDAIGPGAATIEELPLRPETIAEAVARGRAEYGFGVHQSVHPKRVGLDRHPATFDDVARDAS